MAVDVKLTALKVAGEKRPGIYGDGGGLYLQITARADPSAAIGAPGSLALLGAGSKAGIVPLNVWLPLAHPAALRFSARWAA